jgi:uncharacterized repeat protein (TIGR03803 family)
MLARTSLGKRHVLLVLLVFGVLLGAAWAQTESVLYSFCTQANCTDGSLPSAGLVFDQDGNLYGTTLDGGASNNCHDGCGVVFKLTPKGKYETLYTFCMETKCTDGAEPSAGLVFDQKGNLYGTTFYGGDGGYGVVFKLTSEGKETVLYNFCVQNNCTDGAEPSGGLVFDQKGNLYGTTLEGGASKDCPYGGGCGVVFKLTPKGKETVLHYFCTQTNCADGFGPSGGLIYDQRGNLYGTTAEGGAGKDCFSELGCGTVFKLAPEGKETVLHSFCAVYFCIDGEFPNAGLVFDPKGNLYGTASGGGALSGGLVFKLTPKGKETVLYGFCWQDNCADGASPYAGLIFDQKGNLYGTTRYGGDGAYGCGYGCGGGVVFKFTP